MIRREHFMFECDADKLAGSIDHGPETSGLLIVTGGNELRSGPWGSQAKLAERIAASGFPVMRFDRRGVGDSEGENAGFTGSGEDIEAALIAFRNKVPTLRRIVAFGNCDAASALMLAGGKGCQSLVLANPWTFEPQPEIAPDDAGSDAAEEPARPMPPSAIRAHYLRRLTDPRAIWRLLTGKVAINRMATSLVEAARPDAAPTSLAQKMGEGLNRFAGPVTILLAERDRTAQAFLANWNKDDPRLRRCPDASHSFVEPQARIWLQGQLLGALRAA